MYGDVIPKDDDCYSKAKAFSLACGRQSTSWLPGLGTSATDHQPGWGQVPTAQRGVSGGGGHAALPRMKHTDYPIVLP